MENTIQKKLDGKVPSTTVERKSKVKSITNLEKLVSGSDGTVPINASKYFNCLILFPQREDNLKLSLGLYELIYELVSIPMSLFSEKDNDFCNTDQDWYYGEACSSRTNGWR